MKRFRIGLMNLAVLAALMVTAETVMAQIVAYYGGTVKNSDNQPIQNVYVSANDATPVFTDASGAFQLGFTSLPVITDSTPNGDTIRLPVTIVFTHPDYEMTFRSVPLEEGDSVFGEVITMFAEPEERMASGHIEDELNQPIANAHVVFYRIDNPNGWGETFDAYTDGSGNYALQITDGLYYVQAIAYWGTGITMKHKQKWYDDVEDFSEASILTVGADVTGIDFSFTTPVACTISGTVIDQTTQLPVAGAFVAVYSTTLYDSGYHVTDADGHYTIHLYDGEYTVACFAFPYIPLYYNQVENFWEATPVVVSAGFPHATGIDFALSPRGGGTNSIQGNLTDESTGLPLEDVDVIAIPFEQGDLPALPGTFNPIDKTDNNGDYTMDGLANGTYYVLFVHPSYAGEFYGNTQRWENAVLLTLNGNTHLNNINAALTPLSTFGALVEGTVTGATSTLTGGLPGTLISAFDTQDNVVSTGLSGYGGLYELPQLPNGTYTLKASLVGYTTQQYGQGIQINLNNGTVVSGIDFSLSAVLDVGHHGTPKMFALDQNHPNPFNPSTTIRYVVPSTGHVTLSVYNMLGQKIRTLVDETKSAGAWDVVWNGRNEAGQLVASGVYLYKLQAGGRTSARKMTLLK